jgi:hypothetical protein
MGTSFFSQKVFLPAKNADEGITDLWGEESERLANQALWSLRIQG